MVRPAIITIAFALLVAPVNAQSCEGLPASLADLPTVGAVITKAKLIQGKKGEYESTAAFQARMAAVGSANFGHDIVLIWQQPDLVKYNPDTGKIIVDRYTVDTACNIFNSDLPSEIMALKIGPAPKYDFQKQDTPYCLTKDVSSAATGSYIGSNGYGAVRRVHSSRNREEGIFLGVGLIGQEVFPSRATGNVDDHPWLEASVTVPEAKSLKANGALIFVVRPKAPFFSTGRNYIEPTIDSPQEIVVETSFLVGMPVCVALADRSTGKVFASRPFEFGSTSP